VTASLSTKECRSTMSDTHRSTTRGAPQYLSAPSSHKRTCHYFMVVLICSVWTGSWAEESKPPPGRETHRHHFRNTPPPPNATMPIDIKDLRADQGGDPDFWRENQRKRFLPPEQVDVILELDAKARQLAHKMDQLRTQRNEVQKSVRLFGTLGMHVSLQGG